MIKLNKKLIKKQKLTYKEIKKIHQLHSLKKIVFEWISTTTCKEDLKNLVKIVTELEFSLQRSWKFTEDIKCHKFWEVPKCKCPQIDNNERWPHGYYVINNNCPIHGGDLK